MFDIGTFKSLDKKVIFRDLSKTSAEVHYLLAAEPTAALKIILPRQPEHERRRKSSQRSFYIRTTEGAKNFRVVTASVNDPSEKNWKEFVAHRPTVKLEGISLSPITLCCRNGKTVWNNSKCSTSKPTNVITSSFPSWSTQPA